MNNIIWIILGMMLVTYIPRLLPFIIISEDNIPPKLRKFLNYVPYTALGALIIPGAFSATPGVPLASLAGLAFAIIYSWFKGGIFVPVIGSVLITFFALSI
ncbi:AzlD domain-containing protein [Clostridium sediminicola]|uniref:AzlD domain-containing protein n=1 Tax=Clostridium sediminicola TaxID=3114879 RepID=UPI0031F1DDFD